MKRPFQADPLNAFEHTLVTDIRGSEYIISPMIIWSYVSHTSQNRYLNWVRKFRNQLGGWLLNNPYTEAALCANTTTTSTPLLGVTRPTTFNLPSVLTTNNRLSNHLWSPYARLQFYLRWSRRGSRLGSPDRVMLILIEARSLVNAFFEFFSMMRFRSLTPCRVCFLRSSNVNHCSG